MPLPYPLPGLGAAVHEHDRRHLDKRTPLLAKGVWRRRQVGWTNELAGSGTDVARGAPPQGRMTGMGGRTAECWPTLG